MKIAHQSLFRARSVFYGWWIVLSGGILVSMASGLFNTGFGFYVRPISQQFGWSTTVISGAVSLSRFEGGILGPIEGVLIQKFGTRGIIGFGLLCFGAGFMLLSEINGSIPRYYVSFLLMSVGSTLGTWSPVMASINNWFDNNRTKAISFTMVGMGLGGLFWTPLVGLSIERFEWQQTAFMSGIIIMGIGLPLSRLVRTNPEPYGYLPDGVSDNIPSVSSRSLLLDQNRDHDYTLREALATRSFWLMSWGHSLALMTVAAIGLHLVPYLQSDLGFSIGIVIQFTLILTFTQILSHLLGGFYGNKFPKKYIAAITMLGHAIALLILATAVSYWQVMLALIIQGISWGVRGPVVNSMRGDYFGRKHFPVIMGFTKFIMMFGMIIGTFFPGFMDDQFSYRAAFLTLSAASSLGVILFLLMPRPQLKKNISLQV